MAIQARCFGSALGRFSSPDELVVDPDPADPQSWNLYGYHAKGPNGADILNARVCQNKGRLSWKSAAS
jgi:hypothetical protein